MKRPREVRRRTPRQITPYGLRGPKARPNRQDHRATRPRSKRPNSTCNALNLGVEFFFLFLLTKFRCYSLFFSRFAPSFPFQSSIATGVRVMCKQNLSGHECCIMPDHISLSDFVLTRVRCLVPFRTFASRIDFRSVVVCAMGFWPMVRPSPARPGPTRLARP
jgi:hypothetical protein